MYSAYTHKVGMMSNVPPESALLHPADPLSCSVVQPQDLCPFWGGHGGNESLLPLGPGWALCPGEPSSHGLLHALFVFGCTNQHFST